MSTDGMRIAVEGCGHGTLKAIYASIEKSCEVKGWDAVDLLIIGGDFQAVRNATDLNCMAVPMRYREIGDFHEYYSGARVAPYLTLFVGGNHEASNHLWELYYGGWAAPNIYYLGAANVLRLGSLRIAGLSGIWKGYNYKKQHFERLPYNSSDVRSIYHVREVDTRKLLQVRTQVDIGLSHDWPRGIEWEGDWKWLFKKKDLFEKDARDGSLGSVAAKLVLDRLRPPHWFSAHLHIKYAAFLDHTQNGDNEKDQGSTKTGEIFAATNGGETVQNQDEIDLDVETEDLEPSASATVVVPVRNSDEIDLDDDFDAAPQTVPARVAEAVDETPHNESKSSEIPEELRAQLPASFSKPQAPPPVGPEPPHTITGTRTNFLALDKCLPHRNFLQLLEITPLDPSGASTNAPQIQRPLRLSYDPEWLAITRAFAKHEAPVLGDPAASVTRDKGRAHYAPLIDAELSWIQDNIVDKGLLLIPEDFEITAPIYDPSVPVVTTEMPKEYTNPQTTRFCGMLGIENLFDASEEERTARMEKGPRVEEERSRGGFRGGRGGGGGRGGRGFGRGNRGGGGGFGRGRGRGRGRGYG